MTRRLCPTTAVPTGQLTPAGLRLVRADCWQELTIRWTDCECGEAAWSVGDDGEWTPVPFSQPSVNSLSYMHIQSTSAAPAPQRILLAEMEAQIER